MSNCLPDHMPILPGCTVDASIVLPPNLTITLYTWTVIETNDTTSSPTYTPFDPYTIPLPAGNYTVTLCVTDSNNNNTCETYKICIPN